MYVTFLALAKINCTTHNTVDITNKCSHFASYGKILLTNAANDDNTFTRKMSACKLSTVTAKTVTSFAFYLRARVYSRISLT